MQKSLNYAYPTSDNAAKYNNGDACWYIKLDDAVDQQHVFPEREVWKALEVFEAIDAEVLKFDSFTRESLPFQGKK